jgi:diaminopimelate epimerase
MISVEKYHGTGNDFIVVDAAIPVPDRRAFAIDHCDRETGIDHPDSTVGADGVLFLALEDQYSPPRVVMTLVQPDGSVAAMCGNGARCTAAWAARETGAREMMVDTQAGTRRAVVEDDSVRIEMGRPTFTPSHVPLESESPLMERDVEGLTVTAVNTGVPHAVAFVDSVDAVDLNSVAPPVRNASVFPSGTNVTFASARSDGSFDQRTFERGVEGETDSCGTGAVAIAAVAHKQGLIERDESVTVRPPGGDLEVSITDGTALLCGPAVREFETDLPATRPRRIS